MGIRSKLTVTAVIMIIGLMAVGGVGFFSTDYVARLSHDLFENQALPIMRINEIEKAAWEYYLRMVVHSAVAEPEMMKLLEQEMETIDTQLNAGIADYESLLARLNEDQTSKTSASDLKAIAEYRDNWSAFKQSMEIALEDSRDYAKEGALARVIGEGKTAFTSALDALQEVIDHHRQEMNLQQAAARSGRNRAGLWLIGITAASILLTVFGGFWVLRSVAAPLGGVIEGLKASSDRIGLTAKQVSSAGQALAEGAAQQAASVEETSSSLEEMASMVRQNSNNAGTADQLMKNANQIVQKADNSMKELKASMDQIAQASEETFKINKTIDEIAFQTNLLALNAAVEAARAGEAGAGFAVVADEVRNLALRATEAAKNTASLIEGNVKHIQTGVEVVDRTDRDFDDVTQNALKVGGLISEIATASDEQAQGIEQLNRAVSEMDKVIQSNTANAEETAGASEEMKRQAFELEAFVNALAAVVRGGRERNGHSEGISPLSFQGKKVLSPKREVSNHQKKSPNRVPYGTSVAPQEVLPLDDDEFKDF